ncbi:uncharacterized protein LOC118947859 [Oncorhynchus mykiss]|uniref:uncharacterized protein LOC118947670 n=1 Tax=Oncorhynchus mykiss TaxID=8022 RepID=UPI001878A693|nr:uncharacterized protein LOC118947670 [Oncorhynchus mykiss]XP_036828785.1 uncharacterized protein LOC118947859 [Oncorhynchus mykiss]
MSTLDSQDIWKAVGAAVLGFISGVPGGYLLSSTMAAELGGLGPPPEDINKGESEADKGLVTFLTLLIAMFLMLFLPMAVGGILCLAASMAIRKAGETEPDATEVAAVVTVVLMGTSAICGGVGFLLETAVGELTDVLTVYQYTVEMAVKVIFIVVSPFMAALAAGVSVQFGKGAVKLRAAAGIGTGILAALKSQSILGHWGTMGALFGPAAAAGVALSAALRRSSSSYGKAGRLGATLGAMCATWFGRWTLSYFTVWILIWIFLISLLSLVVVDPTRPANQGERISDTMSAEEI